MKRLRFAVAILPLVFLSACSLVEDVTPPPEYHAPTASTAETIYPIVPPDPAQGAKIYAEECATCHGADGRGNGTMASTLSVEVPAIGRPEVAMNVRPVEWFDLVTNGRTGRSMPPFDSLSDRERWDVVAYTLSLHITQAEIDTAKPIFEQQCQGCHGAQGKGNGKQAKKIDVPDWSQPKRLALLSEEALFQTITAGSGDMPAYRAALSNQQRLALAGYVRSLAFASQPMAETAASTVAPEGSAVPVTATPFVVRRLPETTAVSGSVIDGSGSVLPAGLKATLKAYDDSQLAYTRTVLVASDGRFQFLDVELARNRAFIVAVTVQGVDFESDVLNSSDLSAGHTLELPPITIYDVSNDVALLRGDRLHLFIDFSDPAQIQVIELLIFSNPTRQVIAPTVESSALLNFSLPAAASDIQFQDGRLGDGTYLQTSDGFGVAQAYPPDEGYQILFAYNLPYQRKGSFELNVPIDISEAVLMVPQDGVRLKGNRLVDAGTRLVQGVELQLYTLNNLSPDSPLTLSLSGRPPQGTQVTSGSTATLIIGVGAFGLVCAAAGLLFFRRRVKKTIPAENRENETPESLMDAIIALDDQHRAGELNGEPYYSRRSELKQRLEQLLDQQRNPKGTQ